MKSPLIRHIRSRRPLKFIRRKFGSSSTFLLALASTAIIHSESIGNHDHTLLPHDSGSPTRAQQKTPLPGVPYPTTKRVYRGVA